MLSQITAYGDGGSEVIRFPETSHCISWQAGSKLCSITPVRNATWGAIKTLYR